MRFLKDNGVLIRLFRTKLKYALAGVLFTAVICVPFYIRDAFILHLLNIVMLNIALASSWHMIVRVGQFSFGHAGFLAIGAYTSSILVSRLDFPFLAGLIASVIVTAIASILFGIIVLRLKELYFCLATFAFAEIVRKVAIVWRTVTGGATGMAGIPSPSIAGIAVITRQDYYWLIVAFAITVVGVATLILRSPLGTAFKSVRENEFLAECTGINTQWHKVFSFTLASTFVGVGGCILSHYLTYISPDEFSMLKSMDFVVMNLVGGTGTLFGPIIGAAFLTPLPEFLRGFVVYQLALYAMILIIILRFIPGGLVSIPNLVRKIISRRPCAPKQSSTSTDMGKSLAMSGSNQHLGNMQRQRLSTIRPELTSAMAGERLLEVNGLVKRFGGITAVNHISFTLHRGETLGLVGPNGAGKTTLFNLITGVTHPNEGTIFFKGRDITYFRPHKIVAHGIARSFQASIFYTEASVYENVQRAVHSKARLPMWSAIPGLGWHAREEVNRVIWSLLGWFNLDSMANKLVSELPYGLQRQLGVAMALANEPEILLLDEPVGGMNQEEIRIMAGIISELNNLGLTVMVVEHNVSFITGLCRRIIVIDHGEQIAEGSPDQIRQNPKVIEAFLGVEV